MSRRRGKAGVVLTRLMMIAALIAWAGGPLLAQAPAPAQATGTQPSAQQAAPAPAGEPFEKQELDRKSTRLNSSH